MSILTFLGLPGQFGVTLLLFTFILFLAPYLAGLDFGVLRIPDFSEGARRKLKWIGPLTLLVAIFLHIPFLTLAQPEPPANGGEPIAGRDVIPTPLPVDTLENGDGDENPPPDTSQTPPDTSAGDDSGADEPPGDDGPTEVIRNIVTAKIVHTLNPNAPMQARALETVTQNGAVNLTGLVTVASQVAYIVPIEYYLEWIYVSAEGEKVLDNYRTNANYRFKQRKDARVTYYWVEKRIWSDNKGRYVLRVYTRDFGGGYKLEVETSTEVI